MRITGSPRQATVSCLACADLGLGTGGAAETTADATAHPRAAMALSVYEVLPLLPRCQFRVTSAVCVPDGSRRNQLLVGCNDGSVKVFDVIGGAGGVPGCHCMCRAAWRRGKPGASRVSAVVMADLDCECVVAHFRDRH